MQYIYRFKKHHYNEEGMNKITNELFVEDFMDWQRDFRNRYGSAFANIMIANSSTIKLLRKSRRLNKAISTKQSTIINEVEFLEKSDFPDGFAMLQEHFPNAISKA